MKAEIKTIHSPDIDLSTCAPQRPESVYALVEFEAGEVDLPGGDLFGVVVATTSGFAREQGEVAFSAGGHVLVRSWAWTEVRAFLHDSVAQLDGRDWKSVARNLSRIARWEFEDYREADEPPRPIAAPADASVMPVIRGWRSPDVDLDHWSPPDTADAGVRITLTVGNDADDRTADLTLLVATPRWIDQRVSANGPMIGWGLVIVPDWDWTLVADFIDGAVGREWGRDWDDLLERLDRLAPVHR